MKVLREVLVTLVFAIIIFVVLQTTIQSSVVVGSSMEPSLHNGQRLLVNKSVYTFKEPERGDVIVFRPPNNQRTEFIKRIIALSGDTITVNAGAVKVNGRQLHEPYIAAPPNYVLGEKQVPTESYFVLGDNRNNSNDSHKDWTVPRQNIVGKAWLSIWPPNEWGLIHSYPLQEQLTISMNEQTNPIIEGMIWQPR